MSTKKKDNKVTHKLAGLAFILRERYWAREVPY